MSFFSIFQITLFGPLASSVGKRGNRAGWRKVGSVSFPCCPNLSIATSSHLGPLPGAQGKGNQNTEGAGQA